MQWGAYEAWSAYGAEVPLAVPAEDAEQVRVGPAACRGHMLLNLHSICIMCFLGEQYCSQHIYRVSAEPALVPPQAARILSHTQANCYSHAHIRFVNVLLVL